MNNVESFDRVRTLLQLLQIFFDVGYARFVMDADKMKRDPLGFLYDIFKYVVPLVEGDISTSDDSAGKHEVFVHFCTKTLGVGYDLPEIRRRGRTLVFLLVRETIEGCWAVVYKRWGGYTRIGMLSPNKILKLLNKQGHWPLPNRIIEDLPRPQFFAALCDHRHLRLDGEITCMENIEVVRLLCLTMSLYENRLREYDRAVYSGSGLATIYYHLLKARDACPTEDTHPEFLHFIKAVGYLNLPPLR